MCLSSLSSDSDWPSVTDAAEGFTRVSHRQVCGPAPLLELRPAAAAGGGGGGGFGWFRFGLRGKNLQAWLML